MELPGGPTQLEVMAISLVKLGIRHGDTVANIGCVYAIDRRTAAMTCTHETCGDALPQVKIFEGEAAAT